MAERANRAVLLKSRPEGAPTLDNFELVSRPAPSPDEGEMLLKILWLSLDPYMRGRMNAQRTYADPVEIGAVMTGGVVAQVVESRTPAFRVGEIVNGIYGWQDYAIARPGDFRLFRVDPSLAPISTAVGILGMPGQTAYFGLLRIGQPKPGETVVVSAASGAVGAVVGQIAKIEGCRAVGIAGGTEKCSYVVNELGFDACVDYKEETGLGANLAAACPDGIDVYFENVGGPVLEAVIPLLNRGARVPICGSISQYNAQNPVRPAERLAKLAEPPVHRNFIVTEWVDEFEAATRRLADWIGEGRLKYREDVVEGLENAPAAFLGLFEGRNFGKLVVHVADPE